MVNWIFQSDIDRDAKCLEHEDMTCRMTCRKFIKRQCEGAKLIETGFRTEMWVYKRDLGLRLDE